MAKINITINDLANLMETGFHRIEQLTLSSNVKCLQCLPLSLLLDYHLIIEYQAVQFQSGRDRLID